MKAKQKMLIAAAALSLAASNTMAQSVPPLVNYQGRLTDQTGAALAIGTYGIQFRLWDSPTLTNAADLVWGQQQSVTVQSNGVFNVILGSSGGTPIPAATNALAFAFASSNRFLGLTIVSSNSMSVSSPSEILPRQQLLCVPFAISAATASNAVVATTALSVAPGSITTASLAQSTVTLSNLAPRIVGTNVGVGGIAMSLSSGNFSAGSGTDVSNLVVTIVTTGRPVFISLIADGSTNSDSYVGVQGSAGNGNGTFGLYRGPTIIARHQMEVVDAGNSSYTYHYVPSSSFTHLDFPPAGTNTYKLSVISVPYNGYVYYAKLIAFEL